MAQTKTNGKGSAASKKKQSSGTRRSNSPKKPATTTVKQKPAPKPAPKQPNNHLHSVVLGLTAVLVMIIGILPGTRGWLWLHQAVRGLFGVGIFVFAGVMLYTAWLIGQDKNKDASKKAILGLLLTIVLCAGWQLFVGDPIMSIDPETEEEMGFLGKVSQLYTDGQSLRGGGMISAVLVLPLIALFDVAGARIIIALLILGDVMLLANLSFVELLQKLLTPFRVLWNGVVSSATRGIEGLREDFLGEDDEDYEEDENEYYLPEPEPEPVKQYIRASKRTQQPVQPVETEEDQRSRRRKKRDEEKHIKDVVRMLEKGAAVPKRESLRNIDLDIPIGETVEQIPKEQVNQLPRKDKDQPLFTEDFKMSQSDEDELQALVAQAAQEDIAQRESNRLPWMEYEDAHDTNPSGGEPEDESIYEEEPEIPYMIPPLSLLRHADNSANDADKSAELREKGKQLVDTLASFGVSVRIIGIRRGPTVTRYEIQPAAGVKIAKITALTDDIGLNLGGKSVRIEPTIPGKPAVGVEVPNNTKDTVSLREILESTEFQNSQSKLTFAVGRDIDGNVILGDISKMPHMIIAGTTGSGKSVCTNSIIMSILFHATPDEVRLVLVDPKVVEFQPYDGIPHLLIPVVTQAQKAAGALNWAVLEMERRYSLCAQYGVRDLKGYNAIAEKTPELKKLPQILIIIDEFADLMMASGKEVETAVIRIAQKARAAGIHLIIATQRPTVDVITGLIKSNVPSRIGMSVKSAQDSRIILDCSGAETLLGNGDLLFYPNGAREPKRVQGCFCSDDEVQTVANFLKSGGSAEYDAEIIEAVEKNTPASKDAKPVADDDLGEMSGEEALIVKAAELAVDMGKLSTTALQRRLQLGYAKAARIVDELEQRGIVGPLNGAKPREVLMSPQELTEWKLRLAAKGGKVE